MKKINTLKIVKAVSITAISSALIFGLTSCDSTAKEIKGIDLTAKEIKGIDLTAKEMKKFFKLWLNNDKEGIKKFLNEIKQKDKKKYKKIQTWLKNQKYKGIEYKLKTEPFTASELKKDARIDLLSLKKLSPDNFDKISEPQNLISSSSPNEYKLSTQKMQNSDININFLNRLMYTKGEENYEKNKYSFQNRKYHNFDGLEYKLPTYPYSLKLNYPNNLGESILNSAPIYHMLYNSFSPISFFNRCQNGLINKTFKEIKEYDLKNEKNQSDTKFEKMKTLQTHIRLWTKYFGDELIVKAIIEGVTAKELIDNGYFKDQTELNKWFNDLKQQIKLENEIKTTLKNKQTLQTPLKGVKDRNGKKIEINIGNYTFRIVKPSKKDKEQFSTLAYVKVGEDWKKLINQIFIKYKLNKINSNYETNKVDIEYGGNFFTNDFFLNEKNLVKINKENGDIESFNTQNLNLFFHLLPIFKGFAKKDIYSYGTRKGNTKTQIFETKTKSLWYWQNIPQRDGYNTGGKKGLIDVTLTPEMIMEPNFLFKEKDILWLYKNFNLIEFAKDNKNYKIKTENKSLIDYFIEKFSCLDSKLHSLETFIFLFKIAKWRLDILNSYVSTIIDLEKDYSWVDGINRLEDKKNLDSWFDYKVKTTTSIFKNHWITNYKIIDFDQKGKDREFTETRFRRKNDAPSK